MSSTENTHDSSRRRRSPLAVASVAAAVLIAGGGSAYFATAGFGSGDDGADARSGASGNDAKPPLLSLDTPRDSGPGIAPGEPDPGGGTVYRAEGKLPDGPEEAAVHRARGAVTADEVTRLAKALGIPGTPRLVGPAWKIGADKDGSGRMLEVNKQAPGTWTFSAFGAAPSGDNCLKGKACPSGGDADTGRTTPAGKPVSEAAAKKAAAPVLAALGQSDAALDARQLMGAVRVVNADPKVGGLPTYGWTTGVQIGADGQVVGGGGQLKKPAKSASYPVLSADDALKQLNKDARGDGTVGIGVARHRHRWRVSRSRRPRASRRARSLPRRSNWRSARRCSDWPRSTWTVSRRWSRRGCSQWNRPAAQGRSRSPSRRWHRSI